jgi:hypothetical protein
LKVTAVNGRTLIIDDLERKSFLDHKRFLPHDRLEWNHTRWTTHLMPSRQVPFLDPVAAHTLPIYPSPAHCPFIFLEVGMANWKIRGAGNQTAPKSFQSWVGCVGVAYLSMATESGKGWRQKLASRKVEEAARPASASARTTRTVSSTSSTIPLMKKMAKITSVLPEDYGIPRGMKFQVNVEEP